MRLFGFENLKTIFSRKDNVEQKDIWRIFFEQTPAFFAVHRMFYFKRRIAQSMNKD